MMYLHILFCNSFYILVSSSRISQIYKVFKLKSTGTLSFTTCVLIFAGNSARLWTILVEVDNDWLLKFAVSSSAFLNGLICYQFILYWNNIKKNK